MTAPPDVSFDDYMVQSMKAPVQAAAYIEAVMDLEDPATLLVALRHVASMFSQILKKIDNIVLACL
jgi:hypothetical protein